MARRSLWAYSAHGPAG